MPDRTSDVYGVDARREDVVFAMDFRPNRSEEHTSELQSH